MSNVDFWSSEQFFARLEVFLKARGWKIFDLGTMTDISAQSLYSLRKRKGLPSLATLCSICDALGVTLTEFFDVDSVRNADAVAISLKVRTLPPKTVADLARLMSHLS